MLKGIIVALALLVAVTGDAAKTPKSCTEISHKG